MWVGEGGMQAPAPMELINRALGLWKYAIRGKPLPRNELLSLREAMPSKNDASSKAAFRFKRDLRRTIGELTLAGKLDVTPGRTMGIMVMEALCGRKDAGHLSIIVELTRTMEFTLGGYNLKDFTALALRADAWLIEMRGHRSEGDIARRKQVGELLEELLVLLAATREENFEVIQKARIERMMRPVRDELREVFLREPTPEEITSQRLSLETRVSEAWRFIRNNPPSEIEKIAEIRRLTTEYDKAFRKLERRTKNRLLTEEEKAWNKSSEKELVSLQKRSNRLWTTFCDNYVTEVNSILSAHWEMEMIGGVS